MEAIVGQIITEYGLYGLILAGFGYILYRQNYQNLERNKSVERRFDEERQRAAEMENRLLNEMARTNEEKQKEIDSLREKFSDAEKRAKGAETAHLNLQREFDHFKGQSEAKLEQTLRELDQTKALYEEERRNSISLNVINNRLVADNQRYIKKHDRIVEERDALQERVAELEIQIEALRVELDALKAKLPETVEVKDEQGIFRSEGIGTDSNNRPVPEHHAPLPSEYGHSSTTSGEM